MPPAESSRGDQPDGAPPGAQDPPADDEQAPVPDIDVNVIFAADTEADRRRYSQLLTDLALNPREQWSTSRAIDFLVSSRDAAGVRSLLEQADPDSAWTVVPPGEPSYIFRQLFLQGPDARRFRLTDAPAQQTVADVVEIVLAQYPPFLAAGKKLVVDRVEPGGGSGERLSPEQTLHEAGVRDGAQLRLGFEASAGGGPAYALLDRPAKEQDEGSDLLSARFSDIVLTEREFDAAGLKIIQLATGSSSATLELHRGYYTYYWRCWPEATDFAQLISDRHDISLTTLTFAESSGAVEVLPAIEGGGDEVGQLAEAGRFDRLTLLRFDGPDHSWAWQHSPADSTDGTLRYMGCASTANHLANFRAANSLLASSAIEAPVILARISLLEDYLRRWEWSN